MNIKYRFMAAGIKQLELAMRVEKMMQADRLGWKCSRCKVSEVLGKAERGEVLVGKEIKIYEYLQQIAAGLPADI